MSDRDSTLLVGLSLLGTAGCVGKVPATVVVDETQPPERERSPAETEAPRPGAPDRTPPKVVRAELIGNTSVRIHFSEPIVVAEGFEPSDFRISHLRLYHHRREASYSAYYYDPAYYYYGSTDQPFVLTGVRIGENTLDMSSTPALPPARCRELEYVQQYDPPGIESDFGLFLHYAAGAIPVRDSSGNALESFGVDWVTRGRHELRLQIDGEAAKRAWSTLVRVACGPPIPPGPR